MITRSALYKGAEVFMSRNVPKKKWQPAEIEAVKQGLVPEGRTYLQAASYAHKHDIPWKELRKAICTWWWRPEEEELLRKGMVPPNRTWESIRQHKEKMGIPRADKPRFADYKESLNDGQPKPE